MARRNSQSLIQWNPRVSRSLIRRLYETDASGIIDEELIDEVGIAFLVRCESIQRVTERRCHACGLRLHDPGTPADPTRTVSCDGCGFTSSWRDYHRSYKGKRLHGGRAYDIFLAYLQEYPKCHTPQTKMMCIDRLVHAVHRSPDDTFNSPAGQNVIEGTWEEVVELLEGLAYGEVGRKHRPGIREGYLQAMAAGEVATAEFLRKLETRKANRSSE